MPPPLPTTSPHAMPAMPRRRRLFAASMPLPLLGPVHLLALRLHAAF